MDDVGRRAHTLTLLKRAEAEGRAPVSFAELQPVSGIGSGDLQTTLELMVQEGTAQRVPDGIGGFAYGLISEAPGLEPQEGEPEPPSPFTGDTDAAVEQLGDLASRHPQLADALRRHAAPSGEPVAITLTAGIVSGMHAEVIGAMVLAGVDEANDVSAEFRLVVVP